MSEKIQKSFRSFSRSLKYILPYKFDLAWIVLSLILTSSSVLAIGQGIKNLIDKGFKNNNSNVLDTALLILICITIFLAIATFFRSFLTNNLCEKVIADIRKDAYRKIVNLSPEYFEENKTSDIISRLTNDSTLLTNVIANVLSVALRNIILFIGGLILLLNTSSKLSLYVILLIPIVISPILLIGKQVRGLSKEALEKVSLIGYQIEESLNGIFTVQAFNRENFEISQFNNTVNDALTASKNRIFKRSVLIALVIAGIFGAISFVLWIGGKEVLKGNLSAGELSSFVFYSIIVASSLGAISEIVSDLQRASGAIERILELPLLESKIIENPNPKYNNPKLFENINFQNVFFSYPANKNFGIIKNFILEINKGELIAFVGHSGAGKTTLFNLLLRFYDVEEGKIAINNINIKDLSLNNLREHFSIVPQDTVIFSASIWDNIKYGNPDASDNEILEAAKAAEVDEFVNKFPQKYNTFVGERGMRLSGGQKQRIAIARAILKNSPILLLDEATSNLDTENELLIQKAIARLMTGRTTLVIAHRLSTILNADKIIVLDNGEIISMGTHHELIKNCETYQKLAKVNNEVYSEV
ncbi:MAG: ATP-binding cassette domain-containing protein [Sphingobacteriia bacterium]|nr:ATP-binding cassette domain-containing protein [Sphingobacteriia bacterium]